MLGLFIGAWTLWSIKVVVVPQPVELINFVERQADPCVRFRGRP
jgi:hypothetical protein